MSRTGVFFLLVIAPALAVVLALLGLATARTNALGGFLLVVGGGYSAGVLVTYGIRRERSWKTRAGGQLVDEEAGDRSFWLILPGMVVAFFAPPVEYLFFPVVLGRTVWMQAFGLVLVLGGVALWVWARRVIRAAYTGHVSVTAGQPLVQDGPYRWVRHPAYAGYTLMALGISVGYSSLIGLVAIPLLLLPGLAYRMHVEDKLLLRHFGEGWHRYAARTARLVPGVW